MEYFIGCLLRAVPKVKTFSFFSELLIILEFYLILIVGTFLILIFIFNKVIYVNLKMSSRLNLIL